MIDNIVLIITGTLHERRFVHFCRVRGAELTGVVVQC
jgi:hypothetical protein